VSPTKAGPSTPDDLAGRVVLITGAARGLGHAIARRCIEANGRVAVNSRRPERAAMAAESLGGEVFGVVGDVATASDAKRMVECTVEHFGRLDVLVNNAAVAYATPLERITEAEWRRTLDVNLTGAFFCLQAAIPPMKAQSFGRIINISSTAGRSVSTLAGVHYSASKAGMLGLTRAAAKELGPYGITVNAICPGLFDTELARENSTPERLETLRQAIPVRRLGRPPEVAELVCYLASDASGFMTGASLDINGGSLLL
jgi:NAD(P)-dependent dehydrogenase (short-subunit alcohol dehydrogenase family)